MARFTRYLFFIAVLALWLAPGVAFAAPTTHGVPQATLISNTCTLTVVGFADSTTAAVDTYVAAIWGDTLTKPGSEVGAGNYGDTVRFMYSIHNTSNATDSLSVSCSVAYKGGATNWLLTLGNGTETNTKQVATGAAGTDTIHFGGMAEDAMRTFWVIVTIGASGGGNDNGDSMIVTFYVNRDTAQTPTYTGDNLRVYADSNYTFSMDTVTIAGAVFFTAKTGTCTIGGVLSPAKPGATIQYKIQCNNTGSGAGTNVTIYDDLDTVNTTFVSFDTSAVVGWVAEWAPAGTSNFTYGSGSFSNVLPANLSTVKYIRFRNASVAAASNMGLFYRVTIN